MKVFEDQHSHPQDLMVGGGGGDRIYSLDSQIIISNRDYIIVSQKVRYNTTHFPY